MKESKEICDFYWSGKLSINFLKEARKEKLEKLAKLPLVEELIVKFEKLKEGQLQSILMKLSIDELLSIDEYFTK